MLGLSWAPGLHHQADPGRRSAGPRGQSPARSTSSARCAGIAIAEKELDSAAGMQRLLLPTILPIRRVQLAAHYQPSRHAGGDYYDMLDLGDNGLGILVADVSGHGAPAAL